MNHPNIGRDLQRKITREERAVENNPDDRTVYELAAEADGWLMTAIGHMYSSEPDRMSKARQALIKGHGDLVRISAIGGVR